MVSSDHEWLAHLISSNKFWINKVDYSLDSDPSLACMRQLYRMYNCAGSAVRDITVVPISRSSVYNFNTGVILMAFDSNYRGYNFRIEQQGP